MDILKVPADKRADYERQLGQKRSKVNIETFNSPQAVRLRGIEYYSGYYVSETE